MDALRCALLVVLALLLLALLSNGAGASRAGFCRARWHEAGARENFSPDAPGACAANAKHTGERMAAIRELGGLYVLSGY